MRSYASQAILSWLSCLFGCCCPSLGSVLISRWCTRTTWNAILAFCWPLIGNILGYLGPSLLLIGSLLRSLGLIWVVLGSPGLSWALPGSPGLSLAPLHSHSTWRYLISKNGEGLLLQTYDLFLNLFHIFQIIILKIGLIAITCTCSTCITSNLFSVNLGLSQNGHGHIRYIWYRLVPLISGLYRVLSLL